MEIVPAAKKQKVEGEDLPIVEVKKVTYAEIFNLPLFESYLLCDLRPESEYEESHIISAVSFAIHGTSDLEREMSVLKNILNIVKVYATPEHVSPIVLYGNGTGDVKEHIEWLTMRLEEVHTKPLLVDLILPSIEDDIRKGFKSFCKRMCQSLQKIWILDDFKDFLFHFNMLCIPGNVQKEIPHTPCLIAPGLFLGSRNVTSLEQRESGSLSLDKSDLEMLGITHAIVNAEVPLKDCGIQFLRCSVQDNNQFEMAHFWHGAIDFIEQARQNGGRVYVQLHGRSRSASVIVAWAMKVLHLGFESAMKYVMDKCFYKLDTSLMYMDQLKHWSSQTLTHSS